MTYKIHPAFKMISVSLLLCFFFALSCGRNATGDIRIGATLPLTGDIASFGESSKRGMDLALEEVNSAGGVSGRKLEITYEDDRCEGKEGVAAIKKLVEIDKVSVVIGGVCSSVALAMAPIANQSRAALVVPFASSPALVGAGPYVFKVMPSDAFEGVEAANWIHSLGYKKIAVIFTNNAWGVGLKEAFLKPAQQLGIAITTVQTSQEGDKDFRSQLVNIKATQPDAIFAPTYPKEAGQMLKQAKDLGLKVPIFGGDPWGGSKDLIETAGDAANGVFFTAPMRYEGKEYQEFAAKFKAKYGIEPDAPASAGYDSLKIVASVLTASASSGEQIKNALSKVKDYHGATGNTTFDETGSVTTKSFAKMMVKDGTYVQAITPPRSNP